jgi:hypothetical protein
VIIQVWDKAKTRLLQTLKENHDEAWLKIEDLEFKNNKWGYSSCTFRIKRETQDYWEDLEDSNKVYVFNDYGKVCWYGDIEGVERVDDTEETYQVECVGPSARMKNMGTDHDSPNLDPGEKASSYLVDHMLTDVDLGYTEGEIDTNDFEIISGLDFSPGKSYETIANQCNEYNGYNPAVWEDDKFYWLPKEITPTYSVNKKDCETSSVNRNRRGIVNWCQVSYTVDGEIFDYAIAFNQASIDKHGKRCLYLAITGVEAEAQQVADTVIALFKNMKPSSALTTDLIYDASGNLVDPGEVKSGYVLYVKTLLTGGETIASSQAVNESNTWEIAEVAWKDKKATLSPGTEDETIDVMLKQLEMKNTI